MKILIDTNVILDFVFQRQPFFNDSDQVISLAEQKIFLGYVSASTFSDLYYIIRKSQNHYLAIDFLNKLINICQIASVNADVISMALNANFQDFEDAIQYTTVIVNQLDAIVTRNLQDYTKAVCRVFTPSDLIKELGTVN